MVSQRLMAKANSLLYSKLVKPVCFMHDGEQVHSFFVKAGRFLGSNNLTKKAISLTFNYQNPMLEQNILGIHFKNPVGLAAGFDKNAELISVMEDVGFGFVEVGSVTALPCEGNTGKRIDRMPKSNSLWINLGLNNNGIIEVRKRLSRAHFNIPYGISIARTNCKSASATDAGIEDYLISLRESSGIGNYITLNISCPNSYGGQAFANPALYTRLLKRVSALRLNKPIFVKLSPDLTKENIDAILEISGNYRISGFICSNLTKKHHLSNGGLSGKAVEKSANSLIKYLYPKTKGKYILIGTGGIFSAEDAYEKIKLGANLVQLITGMIYQGPALIGQINYGLVKLLEKDGYSNISQAVGKKNY